MRKNQFRRLFALLLALTFIFTVPAPIFGSGGGESSGSSITAGITQDQLEILEELRQQREAVAGLHAFEGVNALADDDSPAKVIVMFDTMPAEVQVVEAMAEGLALSFDAAEATAQSAHDVFRQELGSLFPQGRARTAAPYEIWEEYHHAFLGVSLIVPSDMVPALAELDSVLAVFPDEYVFLDPIELDVEAINEAVEMSLALSATRNASPFGMAHGRSMMRADAMHALGYRGQGVLVAVADTGIDYFHPSFDGAFPTLADMHARGATHITQSDLYYIHAGGNPAHSNFAATTGTTPWIPNTWIYSGFQLENTGYHFLGRNTMAGFNRMAAYNYLGQPGADYPLNLPLESFTRLGSASNTTHGTHVAGTIVGRDGGHANSALGVAPEALMIAYRVLATGGGSVTTILRGYEWAFRDGADVVNSSLGGQHNALNAVHAIGINNMMLANPYIIFVNSAGNAGADGFSSVSDPAAATRGITVSALQPQWPNGAAFVSGAIDASVDFLHANSRSNWFWHPERGVINSFVNLPTEGAYRVFVMPRTEGTNQVAVGLPGIGLQSDFVELMIRYGLDDLRGAFVLVSRGGTFNDVSVLASQFGLGGVIAINGVGQAPPAFVTPTSGANVNFVPYMTISNANGLAIRDAVVAATTDYLEFSFQNLRYPVSTLTLASFSSRGPMNMSYEIKPDIGANGQNTWSARPRNVAAGYANSSGTSMSAPHIAGAVALLVNYSRANHEDLPTASENGWTSEEIKIRLMNTAIRMPVTGTTQAAVRGSVYDTGAGQADVFAAAMADSFAYAIFDRVVQSPHSFLVPIDEATDLGTHRVGSFSFGGVNRLLFPATGFSRTMDAAIVNTSTEARTYTITTEWINYLHNTNQDAAANGVTLTLSATTIPVPAGGRVPFTATMVVPATAANGHYEGFITITDNHGTVVASMPFAAAVVETHPVMRDVRLYRNVISTGEYAQNDASSELGMIFRTASRLRGIGTRTWVFERADGLDHLNWMQPEFADYLVGWADQTEILSNPSTVPGMAGGARLTANQLHRAIVFEGYVYSDWEWVVFDETPELYPQNVGINQRHIVPTATAERVLLDEGDYFLVMEVFETNFLHDVNWMFDMVLPFYVDNTPPELNDLEFEGIARLPNGNAVVPRDHTGDITITGNVFDEWVAYAEEAELTFDIWQDTATQRYVSIANNVAVFMQVDDAPAVRVPIDAAGDFEVILTDVDLPAEITFHVIDNYSVVPRVDRLFSTLPFRWFHHQNQNQAAREFTGNATFQLPNGFVTATGLPWVAANRLVYSANPTAAVVGQHVWTGTNLLTQEITLDYAPLFGLVYFNNGHSNNQSLANLGVIRLWTQLNGVNALVPYEHLEISAVFPDGTCAMAFVHPNRIWNNQDYLNIIDVSKLPPTWERMYLTAVLFGQSVTVVLINDLFVPPPTVTFDIFNNGPGGSPSRPNAHLEQNGTIRLWLQLNGVNGLVPYAALEVEAEFPDGTCAMEFVHINRPWNNQDNVNLIDVSKRPATWERIYLTVNIFDQTIEAILVNREFVPPAPFTITVFNNGTDHQVPGIAGTIRVWTQLDGRNTIVPYADLTVTARVVADDSCAMDFVTINRIWNNPNYVNFIDINKNAQWERINFTIDLAGQVQTVLLINNRY